MKAKIVITIFMFLSFFNSKSNFTKPVEKNHSEIDFEIQYKEKRELDNYKNLLSYKFKIFPKSESFGYSNGTYWFKLVFNKNNKANDIIAYIPTHNIYKIEIYRQNNSDINYITSIGNSVLRKDLFLDYQFPSFLIDLEANSKTTYFLKVNFIKEANFPIKIFKENEFLYHILNKKTINSLYYGTCLIIVLLNLFFFFKLKDNVYLFYSLFLLSLMINFLMYDGSLINLFRGNDFYYSLELIIHVSNEIWFLLFSIKFLNLHIKNPLATKLFFLFPFTVLVLYACYFYSQNFTFIAIADTVGISLFPILWLYGIHNMKKMVYARFYVIGYFLLVPLAVFFIVGYPFGLWNVHGDMQIVKIASWLDIVVFTYAISYRMNIIIKKDNSDILELKQLVEDTKTIKIENISPSNPYFSLLSENNLSIKPLTLREIDILKYLNEGLNNKDISEKLFISIHTVKSHIRNIYTKISVNNRRELKEKTHTLSS